jgi:hypothetical protein
MLLAESHKLDQWPLDVGPRSKSGKLRLNIAPFWKENQLIQTPKDRARRRAPDLENQDGS